MEGVYRVVTWEKSKAIQADESQVLSWSTERSRKPWSLGRKEADAGVLEPLLELLLPWGSGEAIRGLGVKEGHDLT